MSLGASVLAACRRDTDDRVLRVEVLDALRRSVGFDAHVWLLTDPETAVGTSPVAEVPSLARLPATIRAKYLCPANRWTALAAGHAASLASAGSAADRWRAFVGEYDVRDIASVVFRDAQGCWGFLDLWRSGDLFTGGELALLAAALEPVTAALRRRQARHFEAQAAPPLTEPAVLLLDPGLEVRQQTPATDACLRALLPTEADRRPVPAAAYNVAAQLLAVEQGVDAHEPTSRAWLRPGLLLTFRAARLEGDPGSAADAGIAVTIGQAAPAERLDLFCRTHALSTREVDVLRCLAEGADTREVAGRLHLSEYTVQDHLTSVFDRTGVRTRRALLARALG